MPPFGAGCGFHDDHRQGAQIRAFWMPRPWRHAELALVIRFSLRTSA
jgi:hypothetical protein